MTIREALYDEMVTYCEFRYALRDANIGEWDKIVSTEEIIEIAFEKLKEGEKVSHIVAEIESTYCSEEEWCFDKTKLSKIPTPINEKDDLIEALNIRELDLDEKLYSLTA